MSKIANLDNPVGWLIDPHKKWAIHFDSPKKDSCENVDVDFKIDMWGIDSNGKPITFKSRRKVTKQDSLKTWNQLISSNWTKFDFEKMKSA
tara:strand:- start:12 stop:284 length:273 start_codon:yes stop_codon:yes gene_type:complete